MNYISCFHGDHDFFCLRPQPRQLEVKDETFAVYLWRMNL